MMQIQLINTVVRMEIYDLYYPRTILYLCLSMAFVYLAPKITESLYESYSRFTY